MNIPGFARTRVTRKRATAVAAADWVHMARGYVVVAALSFATLPALAQQTPVAAAQPDSVLTEIVVTGSRIARPELERLQPTTVIGSDFIEKRQYTNVVDALNELPAFGQPDNSLVGAQSSFGVGQSFANFFSLGSQRTLTLVDGRRFVTSFRHS